jgi:hypothetical protein
MDTLSWEISTKEHSRFNNQSFGQTENFLSSHQSRGPRQSQLRLAPKALKLPKRKIKGRLYRGWVTGDGRCSVVRAQEREGARARCRVQGERSEE